MDEAKATYCFCGCGERVVNPRLVVTNTNGWELSDELSEWAKLQVFAARTGLDLSGGDLADNIDRGQHLWLELRDALHAGELADRDDETTAVVWRKHGKKARRKLQKQFRRDGIPNPFDLPDVTAAELTDWITLGREPTWAAELDQPEEVGGDEEETLGYRLVDFAFDRRSDRSWEWSEEMGISVAVVKTADSLSNFREEYNLVLDAISVGYWIRQAERELIGEFNSFDPDYAAQLREKAAEGEPEVIVQIGMNEVRESLPESFGQSPEVWEEVVGIAMQALAALGHQLMLDVPEFDDDARISDDLQEFALGLGYGLGVTASALEVEAIQPRSQSE
jgi:hypothetical protein